MAATAAAVAFGTVNFVVMTLFMIATLAIGVFYALRKQDAQGLLISRDMPVAPVALSIMATSLSAILIVGKDGCHLVVIPLTALFSPMTIASLFRWQLLHVSNFT